MAYEKQNWKDALQAAKPEGSRPDSDADQREQKKKARLMYTRRILERDIKQYIKKKQSGIKYKEIDRIARGHGFYTT
jgi:hypothetical protein